MAMDEEVQHVVMVMVMRTYLDVDTLRTSRVQLEAWITFVANVLLHVLKLASFSMLHYSKHTNFKFCTRLSVSPSANGPPWLAAAWQRDCLVGRSPQ